MKKQVILIFVCAVAMLIWVPSGFSNPTWTENSCGACHAGTGDLHDIHNNDASEHWEGDCNSCHVAIGDAPAPSTCVVCHPYPETGKCQLASVHEAGNCLTCHATECDALDCVFDADCEEGELCEDAVCVPSGGQPCSSTLDCAEGEVCEDDVCVAAGGCTEDADCDDDLFCNGIESCADATSETDAVCVDGDEPCEAGEICLEDSDECVECVDDADCEEDETCDGNMCNASGCPEGTPEPVLTFDKDGDCLLNKEEYKAYTDSLKTVQKAEKDTLKTKQKVENDVLKQKHSLEKDQSKLIKTNYYTK